MNHAVNCTRQISFLNQLVEYFSYYKCNSFSKPSFERSQIWKTDHIFHIAQQCHTKEVNPLVEKDVIHRIQHDYTLVKDYRQCSYVTENLKSPYKKSMFSEQDEVSQTRNLLLHFMDCTCRLRSLTLVSSFIPFGWNT